MHETNSDQSQKKPLKTSHEKASTENKIAYSISYHD